MKKSLSFHEIMPEETWKWKLMESQLEDVLSLFNYKEIRLSVLQDYDILFKGMTALLDSEEIEEVHSQIISLPKKEGHVSLLSLRPEGTINVLNHVAYRLKPNVIHRIYYHGHMFRHDEHGKPQEFYQMGVELLGSDSILSENEIISLGLKLCENLGLKDTQLEINSFGCDSCRPLFFKAMREFLTANKDDYCQTCFDALNHNPLHPTDCLETTCLHNTKQGPKIQEHLCPKCKTNFEKVKKIQANLGHDYKANPALVKNFSYYNETVFNFVVQTNGHSEIIGGGGRYDYLSARITGKQIPAVGFYLDLDLIYSIMQKRGLFQAPESPFRVYLSSQSPDLEIMLLQIMQELHENKVSTVISTDNNTTENDTGIAVANGCQVMVILRADNIREGKVMLKNLAKEKQSYVALSDLLKEIGLARKSLMQFT
jgi:histidyl-tRNA synthetase